MFVLDNEMKPSPYDSLSIILSDKEGKKISSSKIENSMTGYHEGNFRLNGKMNDVRSIEVKINDERSSVKQSFDVRNFQIVVDLIAKDVTFEDERITANIYVKHSDGETQVEGKADVKATVFKANKMNEKLGEASKTVSFSAGLSSDVSFDMKEDLKMNPNFDSIIKLQIVFKEKYSDKTEINETIVTVHKNALHTFEIIRNRNEFVSGKPYNFKALIKNFDNSIVKEKAFVALNVRKQFFKSCSLSKTEFPTEIGTTNVQELMQSKQLNNGIAEFEINAPIDAESLILRLQYKDSFKDFKVDRKIEKESLETLEVSVEDLERFDQLIYQICFLLHVILLNFSFEEGEKIKVNVKSSLKISDLFHFVVGKSGIINNEKHLMSNTNAFNFEINVIQDMLPTSDLIVYFIKSSGEIVSNQIQLGSSHKEESQDSIKHVSLITVFSTIFFLIIVSIAA